MRLTGEATVLGTPGFMAPEQIDGSAPVGPGTDLYAVGCLAYWLLTGRPVYEGESAIEVLAHHMRSQPRPPSEESELPIPDALDRVVLACLEKNPADRPASADALAAELAAIQPEPAWTAERARHWWSAHMPAGPGASSVAPRRLP